jgi:dihydropteroate synthase
VSDSFTFAFLLFSFALMHIWKTSRRSLPLDRTLLMGVINMTPDSFSDGGEIGSIDEALRRAEQMIADGADIIDIGGESSRPGSRRVEPVVEIDRVVPVIEAVAKRFDLPISVDTWKSEVAGPALDAGAEILNDISAFRFDDRMPAVVSEHRAAVILMHSRGHFDTLHSSPPAEDIFADVIADLDRAAAAAHHAGIADEAIALDVGLGFGKTFEQNLELISGIGRIRSSFPQYPLAIGASRKSFIGKILGDAATKDRLEGSLAVAAIAALSGVSIVRAHDIKETSAVLKTVDSICRSS